jgi:transcriptional regulator with XRE-family HTH domain
MTTRGTRSLSAEEAERVRAHLEALTQRRGEQATLARRLGVTPQAISRITSGGAPAGIPVARALAEHLGITLDALLGGEEGGEESEPRLCSLPGWTAAEAVARRRYPYLPEQAWEAARMTRTAHLPRQITPEWIASLAGTWARAMVDDGSDPD